MHSQKVVHRDIKPENIMITSNDSVRLIDFGLAVAMDKRINIVAGTYNYMAPEVLNTRVKYGVEADMWSLGCILYEMAMGNPVFPAMTENELVECFYATIGPMPHYLIE